MMILGPIGFAAPWLLLALVALPILWLILRAIPPAPLRQRFPGVALLLGLQDDEAVSDRTPWWLLLLRMLAVAAIIIGLAGPVLNPEDNADGSDGPLLVVLDGSWAGASRWTQAMEAVDAELRRAGSAGREVALLHLSDPQVATFQAANAVTARLAGLAPQPWQPDALDQMTENLPEGPFETVWFSDGLDYAPREDILEVLQTRGPVRVTQTGAGVVALAPATYEDGTV
ncbi:MAG: BatA domain-containing protein, partial [Pseudomonadota bacterium]